MKKLFLLISLVAFLNNLNAQNHVPNPNFELGSGCPSSMTRIDKCDTWTGDGGSPDYFHTCGTGGAGIPINEPGYQKAIQGQAYVGLATHDNGGNFEYLTVPIIPLTPNQTYEISMSVNVANISNVATNNLGVFFYKDGYTTVPISNINSFKSMIPQVHYSNYGLLKDTLNWVRLNKSFIADSAYSHILIGGFNDSSLSYKIDTIGLPYQVHYYFSYYYIDSVTIKPVYPTSVHTAKAVNALALYPNPNNGRFTLNGNTETGAVLNINIVSAVGQLVYCQQIRTQQGVLDKEIELNGLPKGLYLLKATDEKGNTNTLRFNIE